VFEHFQYWRSYAIWALVLVIALPVVLLVLTEIIVRLRRRQIPLEATLRIVRNLVVPTVAVYLILTQVAELDPNRPAVRLVLTLLWIFLIHTALSFVNAVIFAGAVEGTWQARVPKLVRDLGRFLLVLVGLAIVLSTVWGADLGALVTALGVGSIVIGLALQDPLGNLFSGVMLLFERPFAVGDWVRIGDTVGKVVEINWRAVHVLVRGTEIVVVPNSVLAKGSFSNLSRPTRDHAEVLTLTFSYSDPPNKVKRALTRAAALTPGVLEDPPPQVQTSAYQDFSIAYKLIFRVADYAQMSAVRDELMSRIWYVVKRQGLTMPYPVQTHIQVSQAELDATERAPLPVETLRRFPQLGLARVRDLGDGVSRRAVLSFARGERVVAEGECLPGLVLILSGQVSLAVRDTGGQEREIARLGPGEFFGERSLLSVSASEVTATALEDLEVLVLEGESLQALIDQTPHAAREIGKVMESRRRAIRNARSGV
jgi:small-conductance mechanosensitive channel